MIRHFSIFKKRIKDAQKIRKDKNHSDMKTTFPDVKQHDNNRGLADKYGVDYTNCYTLPKAYINDENAFFSYSGLVYFYPPNDGAPTRPIYHYVDHDLVLRNSYAFQEIENLDEILLKMVEIVDKAFDEKIAINHGELTKDYKGKASLVMTNNSFSKNDSKHRKYFINRFLDCFIGWNFGVSVNRNEELKEALLKLNDKVIKKGLREDAGPGFNVYGIETEAYKGLQHYYLPTTNDNYQKRK